MQTEILGTRMKTEGRTASDPQEFGERAGDQRLGFLGFSSLHNFNQVFVLAGA